MAFSLRPALPEDEPFLLALYASTRADEMDAWGWIGFQRDVFVRVQFQAQARHYAALPGVMHSVVQAEGKDVGRLVVARTPEEIRLVDLVFSEAARGRGLGTELFRAYQREAATAGLPLRLTVRDGNPAERLYVRLGFVRTGINGPHVAMEWRPGLQ